MYNFNVAQDDAFAPSVRISADSRGSIIGRYDALRVTANSVATTRRVHAIQNMRKLGRMALTIKQERPGPRPAEMKEWLGRLETPQKKPEAKIIVAPPPPPAPAPKAKGGKGAVGKAFQAAMDLFSSDAYFMPPPRNSGEHLKDGNAIYWAGYDL